MRALLLAMAFAVCAMLSGADVPGISRTADGLIQAGNLKFHIVYWTKDWKAIRQTPEVLTFPGEGGDATPEGVVRIGTFRVSGDQAFHFTEIIKTISANEQKLTFRMESETGIPAGCITWQTAIPLADYKANPVRIDGIPFPADPEKEINRKCSNGTLVLNTRNGTLSIAGSFHVIVRKLPWGKVDVRLMFSSSFGNVKNASLSVRMAWMEKKSTKLNLSPHMNMGFRDEVPEDRRGGWTDQGPENDLRMMTPGSKDFAGIPFAVVDPAKNAGKSCLAMKGEARSWFADEASIDVPPGISGNSLYILNGLAWAPGKGTLCGKVTVVYTDGSRLEHGLKCGKDTGNFWNPHNLENAIVGWRAQNGEAQIGLFVTRVPLDRMKKISKVIFRSANQVWMILAATVSDLELTDTSAFEKLVMRPNSEWAELRAPGGRAPEPNANYAEFTVQPGSVADFSFLLDAPAGKYGYVKVVGDHFEFEKRPGVPVRFWGTNLCTEAVFLSKPETIRLVDELKSMGYNSIRLHHFDWILAGRSPDFVTLDPEKMRRLDFLVSEAAKRGIYTTLDLYTCRCMWGRRYGTQYKLRCYFTEDSFQDLLQFSKNLFGHVNEFTGRAWKDDPSIIGINMINEGTLSHRVRGSSPELRKIIESAYAAYALERGKNPAVEHGRLFEEFLSHAGVSFFNRMKKELTGFGLKVPFSDQNFAGTLPQTRNAFDFVDSHFYWGHPVYLGKQWKLPFSVRADSPVAAMAGGIRDVLMTRISGKPMTVTEWNFCYPNPHSFEGPFLTGAYSALQNFSGLWQFDYSGGNNYRIGSFSYAKNVPMCFAARAAALLFLRDVKTAPAEVSVAAGAVPFSRYTLPLVVRTGLYADGKAGVSAVVAAKGEKIPAGRAPVFHVSSERDIMNLLEKNGMIPRNSVDSGRSVIRSSTGELLLKRSEQFFRVLTSGSEVLLLKPGAAAAAKLLSVKNGNADAAFYAGSLDGKKLEQSNRLILLHLTDLKVAGDVFRDPSMRILEQEGAGPALIRRNTAEIFWNKRGAYTVYACSLKGTRLFRVPLKQTERGWSFSAKNVADDGNTVLLYEVLNSGAHGK